MTDDARDHEGAEAFLKQSAALLQLWIDTGLPAATDLNAAPEESAAPIRYVLEGAGKRLRGALALAACRAVGKPANLAIEAAVAVELIHAFSLVHDDLPAMDDDDLRRGRPTVHRAFTEADAILAGDALSVMAFQVIAGSVEQPPEVVQQLVLDLTSATGVIGMIGGQAMDIASQGKTLSLDDLRDLHARKTGALITASCVMGGRCGGASDDEIERLRTFGEHVGLAFQIADDLLDVTADADAMGKATGKDADAGKNTYPSLLGVDESRRLMAEEVDAALAAVDSFADDAGPLRLLARFAATRRR
ncbi:MAG: polyprenyl synthetase family protein [Planctomycetota bacterium]